MTILHLSEDECKSIISEYTQLLPDEIDVREVPQLWKFISMVCFTFKLKWRDDKRTFCLCV